MKKHIITFEVSAKKNDKQMTKWLVTQDIPYNYIDRGNWCERNPKIENSFTVSLLKSDIDLENMQDSRLDFAGYNNNSGEIIYRGEGMGEIVLSGKKRTKYDYDKREYIEGEYEVIFYPVNRSFLKGENNFLESEVYPKLEKYILDNAESLYEEALQVVKKQVQKQLEDYLNRYDELKKQSENFFIKPNDY